MAASRSRLPGLIATGFQVISLSNSTAQSLNSTLRTSSFLDISVETQPVRFRYGGTGPTLTTGVLLPVGWYQLPGYSGTSLLRFQRSTGTSKVSVQGYKYAGDV